MDYWIKLLNKYYAERQHYEEAIRKYNKAKETYRFFSKEENQLRKSVEQLRKTHGFEMSSDKEWSAYYNKRADFYLWLCFMRLRRENSSSSKRDT